MRIKIHTDKYLPSESDLHRKEKSVPFVNIFSSAIVYVTDREQNFLKIGRLSQTNAQQRHVNLESKFF